MGLFDSSFIGSLFKSAVSGAFDGALSDFSQNTSDDNVTDYVLPKESAPTVDETIRLSSGVDAPCFDECLENDVPNINNNEPDPPIDTKPLVILVDKTTKGRAKNTESHADHVQAQFEKHCGCSDQVEIQVINADINNDGELLIAEWPEVTKQLKEKSTPAIIAGRKVFVNVSISTEQDYDDNQPDFTPGGLAEYLPEDITKTTHEDVENAEYWGFEKQLGELTQDGAIVVTSGEQTPNKYNSFSQMQGVITVGIRPRGTEIFTNPNDPLVDILLEPQFAINPKIAKGFLGSNSPYTSYAAPYVTAMAVKDYLNGSQIVLGLTTGTTEFRTQRLAQAGAAPGSKP